MKPFSALPRAKGAVALLAWATAGCVAGAAELPGHKLLLTSVRTGDTEVCIASPATGDMHNVTRYPGSEDRYPCWSPDGNRIAFVSDRQGATNLWVMDVDGGNLRRLFSSPAVCYMPSWQVTPQGERIVFGLHGERPEMASIKPDGTGLENLGEGRDPTLSPDGRQICYTGNAAEGGVTVYVMRWDGSDKRRVLTASSKLGATFPNWSPDAKQIVYSWPVGETLELFIVGWDGSNNRQLTHLRQIATPAAWSPDGQWISFRLTDERYWADPARMQEVYRAKPAGKRPVWVVRPDGTDPHVVESLRWQMGIDGSRANWQPAKIYPKSGALPDLFPERGTGAKNLPDDTYVLPEPRRNRQDLSVLDGLMPGGTFAPPANRWVNLPRTREILRSGGALHIVNLGDSIVNDTARSGWLLRLQGMYPGAQVRMTTVVRGGGACWYYKQQGRIKQVVAPLKPDLVFIGGISQRGDIPSIREVIEQLRVELPKVEVLLGTGAWGGMDPLRPDSLAKDSSSSYSDYGPRLQALAVEAKCGFVDVTRPWAEYIQQSGWRTDDFKRDAVHANSRGEQILGRIMCASFAPE